MNLLVDTHTFLWYVWGDNQLSGSTRSLIDSIEHRKYLSIARIWEMAIKLNLGKLQLATPFPEFLFHHLDNNGFEVLPIERLHILQLVSMPLHHRDPFDRMLIAQSITESMPILSVDEAFDSYSVNRIW